MILSSDVYSTLSIKDFLLHKWHIIGEDEIVCKFNANGFRRTSLSYDRWCYDENDEMHYVPDVIKNLCIENGMVDIKIRLKKHDIDERVWLFKNKHDLVTFKLLFLVE